MIAVDARGVAGLGGCGDDRGISGNGHDLAKGIAGTGVAGLEVSLLGDGIYRNGVTRAALVHEQAERVVTGAFKTGREHPATRIPGLEAGEIHYRRPAGIVETDAALVFRDLYAERSTHREHELKRTIRRARRALMNREALLQPARVVNEPFPQRGAPLIGYASAFVPARGLFFHRLLGAGKAVAVQLQPPCPASLRRCDREAAPVEPRAPLLPGVVGRKRAVGLRLYGMSRSIARGSYASPVGGSWIYRIVGLT